MALVRVKDADGNQFSIGRDFAEKRGLTILDRPAVDSLGHAVRTKRHVTYTSLKGLKKSELLDLAAERGVDVGDSPTVSDLRTALGSED